MEYTLSFGVWFKNSRLSNNAWVWMHGLVWTFIADTITSRVKDGYTSTDIVHIFQTKLVWYTCSQYHMHSGKKQNKQNFLSTFGFKCKPEIEGFYLTREIVCFRSWSLTNGYLEILQTQVKYTINIYLSLVY